VEVEDYLPSQLSNAVDASDQNRRVQHAQRDDEDSELHVGPDGFCAAVKWLRGPPSPAADGVVDGHQPEDGEGHDLEDHTGDGQPVAYVARGVVVVVGGGGDPTAG
jgi:hypothetical protein